jgi:hypothetical protein
MNVLGLATSRKYRIRGFLPCRPIVERRPRSPGAGCHSPIVYASASKCFSKAALALYRALFHHLVQTKRLRAKESEFIRQEALGDLPARVGNPAVDAARSLIEIEFP